MTAIRCNLCGHVWTERPTRAQRPTWVQGLRCPACGGNESLGIRSCAGPKLPDFGRPERFDYPCLIGMDYDEPNTASYRGTVIEVPLGEERWATGDATADLQAALLWFATEGPTQALAFRSSVVHFQQDQRRAQAA